MNQAELYKGDPTIRLGEDGKFYHYPRSFWPKLVFLIFSITLIVVGVILAWEPGVRYLFGERASARLIEIRREHPSEGTELIRYRKQIPEGSHLTKFFYTVSLQDSEGVNRELLLAIGSIRNPFANINDTIEVIFFPDDEHAYELFAHRTWSFGASFIFVGSLLTLCAIPTLYAVGKPILIDPEACDPSENEMSEKD